MSTKSNTISSFFFYIYLRIKCCTKWTCPPIFRSIFPICCCYRLPNTILDMHVFIWYVFFLKNSQLNTTCIPSIFFTILCFELTYLSVCKLDFKRKKYHVTYMYHRIHNQKLTVVNEYATEWYRIIWRTNEANRLSYLQPMHLNMSIGTYKFEF